MAKRLEEQLEEARAALNAARAALAGSEATHKKAIEAAEAAHEAASAESRRAGEAHSDVERRVAAEQKLATYTRDGTRHWHPEFLKRVAVEVGFHFNEREKIDPKNTSDSLYQDALNAVFWRVVNNHPDVKVAKKVMETTSALYHVTYRKRTDATRPVDTAQWAVTRCERDVKELEAKIAGRAAEKKAAVKAKGSGSLLDPEFEAKAKAARAVLRTMVEGKKKS
jgi:hypothetical protein